MRSAGLRPGAAVRWGERHAVVWAQHPQRGWWWVQLRKIDGGYTSNAVAVNARELDPVNTLAVGGAR